MDGRPESDRHGHSVLDRDRRILWRRPCTCMSMMSNALLASACETDITGLVGMIALQAAAGRPAALLDWNNNYGDDPDKGVLFHCSNLPRTCSAQRRWTIRPSSAARWARKTPTARSSGAFSPPLHLLPRLHRRPDGLDLAYVGEGDFTDDPLKTFAATASSMCGPARPAGLHLPERLRAPHGHHARRSGPGRGRGAEQVPGLGRLLSRGECCCDQ